MISHAISLFITFITLSMFSISNAQAAFLKTGAFRKISPEEAEAIVAALSSTDDPYANRKYPVISRTTRTDAPPIANAQRLSPARTSPSKESFILCQCADFISNIPHDEEAALEYVLNDHSSLSAADQRTIFEQLTNSGIPPIDWVYVFEKNTPKKKTLPHPPTDIAYALVDILSSPHVADRSVWPATQSLIALCLHKLRSTAREVTLAQGAGDRETLYTIGATRNALRLVEYACKMSEDISRPSIMAHNKYRLNPPACAVSKTMLQLFNHYGADFSWRRPDTYETLLHLSMHPDHCPCTTHYLLRLCSHGIIDTNAITIYSENALHLLAQQSKYYNTSVEDWLIQKLTLLCESGIDISARNHRGQSAVQILEAHMLYWRNKIDNGHFLTRTEEKSLSRAEMMLDALRIAAGKQRSSDNPCIFEPLSSSPPITFRPPAAPTGSPRCKSSNPNALHGEPHAS